MRDYSNIKKEKLILESAKSRQIVSEIMNFGVSQNQIEVIIKLLALELDDRDKMLAIRECVDKLNIDKIEPNKIIT